MRALPVFRPRHALLATLIANAFVPTAFAADASVKTSPVVVTATRVEQNSFDLPVSIDVVGGDTIRDGQPQINLTETSVRIPGVIVNNRYNATQDLAISTRGFGARSAFGVRGVRLYADGIPLTMPDGQGQTGTFNLDTAKTVEFMRGPFSALYGNSSGGVVQLFTRDGSKEPTISGGVTFGSYDTQRASTVFEGQSGNLNYIVSASDLRSDGYRDHSKNTKDTFHAKLTYAADQGTKVTLIASSLDQFAEDPLALTKAQYESNPRDAGTNAISRNARVYRTHSQAGLSVEHTLSSNNSISMMGYYGVRDNQGFQQLGTTGRVVSIDRNFGGIDAKWTHRSELGGRPFSLVAGVNYDQMKDVRSQNNAANGILGALTREDLQKVHNFDQYIQGTFEPSASWLLVAGLRHTEVKFDMTNRFASTPVANGSGTMDFSNTSPVLGATFKLTPSVNLYANYGKGFETPTFIEVSYTGDPTAPPTTGPNLSIQPSKSKNYELGVKAFVTNSTRLNLALFRVDTDKEVVLDQGTGTTASFKNAGKTERTGVELSLDSTLPNNFNFYTALTYLNAKFKDGFCTGGGCTNIVQAGNKIPGTYRSTVFGELSWKHPATGFSAALEGISFSDTFTTDSNNQKSDGYTLFNLRTGLTQNIGGWSIKEYLRIENLGDKKYVSSVRVNASTATTGAFYEPGAPRNWMLGFNANYKF
jgi:iron complex outermembrane receptor protein